MKIQIDNKIHEIDSGKAVFSYGEDIVLSGPQTDISYEQKWHKEGYHIFDFLNKKEFKRIQKGVSDCLGFNQLEKLNLDDKSHYELVKRTRDLFPSDFNFSVKNIINKLSKLTNLKLTDIDPDTGNRLHIIIRINRPRSIDFNPPHKDIYQQFDETGIVPKCINFWIPICGVTSDSMLPLAPRSHKIPENKILRTRDGGIVNDKKYRVRSVAEWDGSNKMIRPPIEYGQVLIFSSHLIHGAAINDQDDITRVALEFRLFNHN